MPTRTKQNGATLITALIMLVVLTLLVVSGMRASNTNLRIVGNMQMQEEVIAAAQQGIEQVLSSNFALNPASAAIAVDIDNNGSTDYTAMIDKPVCTSSVPFPANVDINDMEAAGCASSASTGPSLTLNASGVAAASTQASCYKQNWDIRASVSDNNTGASTVLHQGAFLHVKAGTVCP